MNPRPIDFPSEHIIQITNQSLLRSITYTAKPQRHKNYFYYVNPTSVILRSKVNIINFKRIINLLMTTNNTLIEVGETKLIEIIESLIFEKTSKKLVKDDCFFIT